MTESTVRDDAERSLISGWALMLLVGMGGVWTLGLDDWRTKPKHRAAILAYQGDG